MSNPLYQMMNNNNLVQQFQQFKNTFKGDPKEKVQQMLNNGQITQEQVNRAVQMAEQFKTILR